jgi:hypothetical protein
MSEVATPRLGRNELHLLLGAVALGVVLRLTSGWSTPLWIDETYTGVIAGTPDFAGLVEWLRHELSGPVFYTLAWLTAKVAGLSNAGLRAPSYILAVATVLFVAWRGHPDRALRLTWAALIALWWPGIMFAAQARPQALLIFLAVLQAKAFIGIWKDRHIRLAWLWTTATSLMVLTHLYSIIPAGMQFLALAWVLRDRAWRFLPPLIAFVPLAGWYVLQLPYYAQFVASPRSFYPAFGPDDVMSFAVHLVGGTSIIAWVALGLSGAITVLVLQSRVAMRPRGRIPGEAVLAASAVAAAALIFSIGMFRDSYVDRYLIPCGPAALLGIALAIRHAPDRWRLAAKAIIPLLVAQTLLLAAVHLRAAAQRDAYPAEFEQVSEWLMEGNRQRPLVFAWDSPATTINTDRDLAQIGGFFFSRAGRPREIIVARPPSGEAGAVPLARAALKERADLIWLGDGKWPRSLLGVEGLTCRVYHRKKYTQVVACRFTADRPEIDAALTIPVV